MKKTIVFLLLLIIASSFLFSKQEIWLDIGLASGRAYVSSDLKDKLSAACSEAGSTIYNSGNPDYINFIGPSVGLIYFPFSFFRLGVNVSSVTNLTIGFNHKGSAGTDFKSSDLRQDFKAGLSYYQMFSSSFGLFTDVDFGISLYRFGLNPEKNVTTTPDFFTFKEYNLSADFGLIQKNKDWFFKFGCLVNKNYYNDDNSGWSLDAIVSGGYIF